VGEEIAGPEHQEAGKIAGSVVGSTRLLIPELAIHGAKSGYSWVHDFLGFGMNPKGKAANIVQKATEDAPKALAAVRNLPALSPGAQVPLDIGSEDAGLIALRRSVMANDAELAGDYQRMQRATEEAIKEDAKLNRFNFPDTASWLAAKQKALENGINLRLQQAVTRAEQDTDAAFRGTVPNPVEANAAKAAYAINLRAQLLYAQDELDSVVKSKWAKVDKTLPTQMDGVYDELRTLKAEHKARPGESDARFPNEVVDRFFETKPDPTDPKKAVQVPKFKMETKLQDVIDLDSEIQQAIRRESAMDAPDRVHMAYLTRISAALQRAKEAIPDAATNASLKDALQATKHYHETFSRGPVGQVLGHDVPGAPNVFPGDTIRHFLSQGPGGIDAFDSLMRAASARTGQTIPMSPSITVEGLMTRYIRQDFYDAAMPNGQFNARAAQQWMKNNASALLHFEPMRKEFEAAIASNGASGAARDVAKMELDALRKNRAGLFLEGDPGKLFNGAVKANDQYGAAKDLVRMTAEDPTGRATEGLVQMALDNMLATSIKADRTSMALQRVDGLRLHQWAEQNKGVIKALDEAIPGTKSRFDRIARTGRYLEGFQIEPKLPGMDDKVQAFMLRDLMARVMGARFGAHLATHVGGSIQTASLGSKAFASLADKLTPDQARGLIRRAMVDPDLFEVLMTSIDKRKEADTLRLLHPYFYSMGIPLSQPTLTQPEEQKK
jgi:hypothetical protein